MNYDNRKMKTKSIHKRLAQVTILIAPYQYTTAMPNFIMIPVDLILSHLQSIPGGYAH